MRAINQVTWNRNLEHEGLQFQSDSKPSQDIISQLKANGFRWSSRQKLWYAKELPFRVEFLNSIATYGGEIGEKLTFAEKISQKTIKAVNRAEYFEEKAEKTHKEASSLLDTAHKMADIIPFGQPILIGHHSEGRDRRYRARIDTKYQKSFETEKKAKYYEQRAQASSEFVEKTFDVGVTLRRIEKLEAELRGFYRDEDQYLARYELKLNQLSRKSLEWDENHIRPLEEEIAYWKAKVEETGAKVWTKDDFQKGEIIKTRFGFGMVLKTNPKTVKVEFIGMAKDAWEQKADFSKVPYNELSQDCKTGKTIDQFPQYTRMEA